MPLKPLFVLAAVLSCACAREAPAPTESDTRSAPAAKALSAPAATAAPATRTAEPRSHAPRQYRFSEDRFSKHVPAWTSALERFSGRANLRYLAIGAGEGRSLIWMLENVLTGPQSAATVLDPLSSPHAAALRANIEALGSGSRVRLQQGVATDTLRRMAGRWFNVISISGVHTAPEMLSTALLAWDSLAPEGVLIFSDYDFGTRDDSNLGRELPDELRPGAALDAFVTAHRPELRVLHRGSHLIVRRVDDACLERRYDPVENFDPSLCSAVGSYLYNWKTGSFYGPKSPPLSAAERNTLESFLISAKLGQTDAPAEVHDSAPVRALFARLGVDAKASDAPAPP